MVADKVRGWRYNTEGARARIEFCKNTRGKIEGLAGAVEEHREKTRMRARTYTNTKYYRL